MPATVSAPSRTRASAPPPRSTPAPWHVWAVLFASTSVVVGVLWDISWHSTIGRDTFWSPPHLAIYLGGVVAGAACGWHVLRTTFAGSPEERAAGVTFWRWFHGPLGAWVCIWGAFAMLTSAPFDDWWHNAYGLDVKILSPPHAVLALGILAIQAGALLMVLARQNRQAAESPAAGVPAAMVVYASGLVLINFGVVFSEYTLRIYQHGTLFYQVVGAVMPFPLVAAALCVRARWPATATAAVYTGFLLLLVWVFPLFPAEPRLAPVRFPLDRMVPPQYPLLLLPPALAVDLVLRWWGARPRGWTLATALGAAFLVAFVAVQWPFADLLQSPYARGAFFGQGLRPYMVGPEALSVRGEYFMPAAGAELAAGLLVALGLAVVAARLGVAWGGWLRRVRR